MAKPRVRTPRAVEEPKAALSGAAMTWMQRLRQIYDIDVSVCPNCGGDLKVLAVITEPQVIASILAHHRWRPEHSFIHLTRKRRAAIGSAARL